MNFPLIFLTLFGSIFAEKFRYDDFKVVQFKVDTNSQLEKILELDGNTREVIKIVFLAVRLD